MENKNVKLEYITTEMEIIAFENEDIITGSCSSYDSEESCVGDI